MNVGTFERFGLGRKGTIPWEGGVRIPRTGNIYLGYIGVYHMGIMEKKMEPIISGYILG